ncbi:MAG: IS200/IS605 family transposase [archaeon]|nr:IS200/IS605 family transposase [archaeon]
MGETEAKVGRGTRSDLRHDNHTVSLLTDHLVFSPKYRGKVLDGEVAEAAEEIIRETCKELDIEVIDMAVNADHVHLFIKNPFCKQKAFTEKCFADPPKYSVSWIAKRIKGRSSKQTLLEKAFTEKRFAVRDRFSHLKEWCPDHLWAPSCYHKTFTKSFIKNASQSVGRGWEVVEKYITGQKNYYRKEDAIPVVLVDEEKERTYKIGFITLHTKFFTVTGPVP